MKSRIFALSLLCLLLAGCGFGGKDHHSSSGPQKSKEQKAIEAFQAAKGVALVSCGIGDWTITVLDPATGKQVATLDSDDVNTQISRADDKSDGKAETQTPCSNPQVISPDRHRIAVTISGFKDGSQHAGWVDLNSATMTDVTAKSADSGFSADIPQDDQPLFASNGAFWFIRDDDMWMSVTGDNAKPKAATSSKACNGIGNDFTVVANIATHCEFPNPSGTFAVKAGFGESDGIEVSLLAGSGESQTWPVVADGKGYDCVPQLWINDSTLLCRDGSDKHGGYRTLVMNSSEIASNKPHTLHTGPVVIPASDRDIAFIAASPDGTQLLLAATAGDENAVLYRASISNPGEPQKITDLPDDLSGDDIAVLGWKN